MFRQPNLSNFKFSMTQAINPHIQQPSNKFVETTLQPLSKTAKNTIKKTTQKVLNKDIKLASKPNTDTVVLSNKTTESNKIKTPKNNDKSYGRAIKKVLSKYFDNDGIDKNAEKQANLNKLVGKYGQESYHKYKAPRIRAKKAMSNEGLLKARTTLKNIIDTETEIRKKHYVLNVDDFSNIMHVDKAMFGKILG